MAGKTWTIKLKYFGAGYNGQIEEHWQVEQVVNSVQYNPGQILLRNDVNNLCNNEYWQVTVVNGSPR